jgi:hypothetical protein
MIKLNNLLNEVKISEGLEYHIQNDISLEDCVFRYGSKKYFLLMREAKSLMNEGAKFDYISESLLETDLGEFAMYEDKEVPLDFPMINEVSEEYYVTYNKGRGQGKGLITTKESDYTEPRVFSKEEAEEYVKRAKSGGSMAGQITAYWVSDKDMNRVDEAKSLKKGDIIKFKNGERILIIGPKGDGYDYQDGKEKGHHPKGWFDMMISSGKAVVVENKKKKDPPIGKPKRGGSKAYYVYVRDPKTKNIKKVSFGSGGLRAKINDPKKRKAFAARHKCSQKTDRTKASYWSCRLPRYAKQLGLSVKNPGAFW